MDDFGRELLAGFYERDRDDKKLERLLRLYDESPAVATDSASPAAPHLTTGPAYLFLFALTALFLLSVFHLFSYLPDRENPYHYTESELRLRLLPLEIQKITSQILLLERDLISEDLSQHILEKSKQMAETIPTLRTRFDQMITAFPSSENVIKELGLTLQAWQEYDEKLQKLALSGDQDRAVQLYYKEALASRKHLEESSDLLLTEVSKNTRPASIEILHDDSLPNRIALVLLAFLALCSGGYYIRSVHLASLARVSSPAKEDSDHPKAA